MHKVSVIIPTYKRSDFLLRAIDSILNQTYSNIEIVVVDDNPPDSSYRIETEQKMKVYSSNKKVVYIKNERNLGGGLARNKGIAKTSGKYITFLDDDDIYLTNKVKSQVIFMNKNNLDMSFTDVRLHNSDDKLVDYREHSYLKNFTNEELLRKHIMHHLTPTATYMFKREVLLAINGFDNVSMGQEFKLMLKTIESKRKIGYFPVANVIQYLHDGERISVGTNKLEGEKELFEFKKGYFNLLNFRQRQYVRFRHHLVMFIVGLRSDKKILSIKNLLYAIVISPIDFFLEGYKHFRKIKKYRALND